MRVTTRGISPATVMLAASLGLSLAGAHRSFAAPDPSLNSGPRLKLLSPRPSAAFEGVKPIEIDAMYEGVPGNGIVSLDLYIDGVKAQSQPLASPEMRGMVSFLVDSSLLTPGAHYVVVRATAADAEVRSVRGSFVYEADATGTGGVSVGAGGDENALAWPAAPGAAPLMRLMSPVPNSKVQGTVSIKVDATDANGKPPYVSIFVDGDMKQLVNYRPFEYDWDTTPIPNGWHTITVVEAFDDDSTPVAHLQPIRVYVNNPGGETQIRTDLLDGPKVVKPALSRPAAPPAPRKTVAARPLARRPLRETLAAVPRPASPKHTRIAALAPRWDGFSPLLSPALSDPAVADLPAPPAHPVSPRRVAAKIPTTGFKQVGTPLAAAKPSGKQGHHVAASLKPPTRVAEAGSLDERFAPPMLALPSAPAAAAPSTIKIAVPSPRIPALHLRIHMPLLPLRAPAVIKPHVGIGAASLLQVVGEKQLQFNHTNVELDRPLAIQQNVLFGPLRSIFEYGGGTLQWNARGGTVRAQTATRDIQLTIGNRQATLNKKPFTLDAVPYISAGRTMVPLSFISAAMNATVQYDPATGHLKITSRQ